MSVVVGSNGRQRLFPYEKMLFLVVFAVSAYLIKEDYPDGRKKKKNGSSHFWTANYKDGMVLQYLVVCVASLVADFFVLGWHSQNPPHPKFRLRPARKLCIFVHIVSGSVEIVSFVAAFFASDPVPFAKTAAYAALALHVPSSLYQWPIVFGVKKFMIPSYFMFILTHVVSSTRLLEDPSSLEALLQMCVALHGYVWVRVSIFIFKIMKVLKTHEYTGAIFFTGFLNTPLVLGKASNYCFIVAFMAFQSISPLLIRWNMAPWGSDTAEYNRETVITDKKRFERALLIIVKQAVDAKRKNAIKLFTDHELAKAVFNCLDSSKRDGVLSSNEATALMKRLGFPKEKIRAKFKEFDKDASGGISFEEFYRYIWKFNGGTVQHLLIKDVFTPIDFDPTKKLSSVEQAKLIFEALDMNDSGTISMEEISDVLLSWGLPAHETAKLIKLYDKDGNKVFDLQEFTAHFKPVWEYAYMLLEEELMYERTIVVESKKII